MPIKVGCPFSLMIKGPPLSPPSSEGPLDPDGGWLQMKLSPKLHCEVVKMLNCVCCRYLENLPPPTPPQPIAVAIALSNLKCSWFNLGTRMGRMVLETGAFDASWKSAMSGWFPVFTFIQMYLFALILTRWPSRSAEPRLTTTAMALVLKICVKKWNFYDFYAYSAIQWRAVMIQSLAIKLPVHKRPPLWTWIESSATKGNWVFPALVPFEIFNDRLVDVKTVSS